ncbi:uncharacterized protein [Drosophila takahashii]|uniref:uncharacterized protein n=1 Tax=Drosophila takahashii TaxID=29030 RepID=UPI001CF89BA6|nr:uncharacterized protein LOC108066510 [Drosophila takahashii]
MSSKLNDALELLIENLSKNPTPEQQKYMQDATDIYEQINQGFTKSDSIFKGLISNWDETYCFFNNSYPKIVSGLLQIKMPFKIVSQRIYLPIEQYHQLVILKTTANHPGVVNGYLSGEKLTNIFDSDLMKAMKSPIKCKSGTSYRLSLCMDTYNSFEIKAVEFGLVDVAIVYRFFLEFYFLNDSTPYICVDTYFAENRKTEKQIKIRTIHATIQTLMIQLNLYSSLSIPVLSNILDSIDWVEAPNACETLLKIILMIIPRLQNSEPLRSVYKQLLKLKHSNSVDMSVLKKVLNFP